MLEQRQCILTPSATVRGLHLRTAGPSKMRRHPALIFLITVGLFTVIFFAVAFYYLNSILFLPSF